MQPVERHDREQVSQDHLHDELRAGNRDARGFFEQIAAHPGQRGGVAPVGDRRILMQVAFAGLVRRGGEYGSAAAAVLVLGSGLAAASSTAGVARSRLVIRYQLRSWLSNRPRDGEFGVEPSEFAPFTERLFGAPQDDAANERIEPGPGQSASSLGLSASIVILPRPTRLSTASTCGLASPSEIVEAPAFGFKTVR